MKQLAVLVLVFLFFRAGVTGQTSDTSIMGRWDLVVHQPGREVPSWLEIQRSGVRTLVGRFTGGSGCARPVAKITYTDGKFNFSIPPQWERAD